MAEEKVFNMYIVSEGDIQQLDDLISCGLPSDEVAEQAQEILREHEYNNLQNERLEIFVTKDCFQVHVDGKPLYEYRGPDARSFAASTRVHGITTDESGIEEVLIAGWWGFQTLAVESVGEQFCHRSIHKSLIAVYGDDWPAIQNLRD